MNPANKPRPLPGTAAPEFELKGPSGEMVRLSSFRGKKVLLAFYPYSFSPVCTEEFCSFRDDIAAFTSRNVELLGISVDSHYAQKAYMELHNIPHSILSDFERTASAAYGVLRPNGSSERAYVLIDENGLVQYVHVMDSPGKRLNNEYLLSLLTATTKGD